MRPPVLEAGVVTQTARPAAPGRLARLLPRRDKSRPSRHIAWRLLGYAVFIAAWQLLSTYVFEPFILPAPSRVLEEMREIVTRGDFWENFFATTRHLAIGFTLAYVLGTAVGIAMGRSAFFDGLFRDYVMVTLTTPGLVFALIALMVFGLTTTAPIVAIVLTSLPHVTVNVVEGVRAIPRELTDMAAAYGVGRFVRLRHIILPAVAPFMFAAVRYGFAIAWKITALTELFGGREGVGVQIRVKYELFNTAGVLAWAFFLVALALVTDRLILQRIERHFFRWRPKAFA